MAKNTQEINKKIEEASGGAVVGIVIIVLVLISGALVVFYNQYQKSKAWQELYKNDGEVIILNEPASQTPLVTSTSTNIEDIEKDLEKTDIDSLQNELDSLNIENI